MAPMGAAMPTKKFFFHSGRLGSSIIDVEPGEAQSRRDGEHDGADPAHRAQLVQDEAVEDQRRGHAEIQEVGQGIEFRAETGGSLQEPGDPPVDAVEEGGDDHRNDRLSYCPSKASRIAQSPRQRAIKVMMFGAIIRNGTGLNSRLRGSFGSGAKGGKRSLMAQT